MTTVAVLVVVGVVGLLVARRLFYGRRSVRRLPYGKGAL